MAEEKKTEEKKPEQAGAKPEAKPQAKPEEKKVEEKEALRHFVRVANTDIEGVKNLVVGLSKVKGINMMFANAVCQVAGISVNTKTGKLTDDQIKKLNDIVKGPSKFGVPIWMFNRRKDFADGVDKHLLMSDLQFTKENDIKMLRKIKCYRGVRHSLGLPVRGQNTRSNFRRNKTKGKASLGVKKRAGAKSGK